jgi:predicted alpha/beta-fold hydrolase
MVYLGNYTGKRYSMTQTSTAFSPAWWCRNPHLQTIIGALLRRSPQLPVQRERWEMTDGDFLDIDRLKGQPQSPRIILLHGLEGSSRSPDIRALMAAVHRLGWESIAMNFRTCSGEPNRLRRAYHAGETADLAWVIEQVLAEDAQRPVMCIGISLGGNVLLKYLGERGTALPGQLKAAVTISTPYDLGAAMKYVEQGVSWLYIRRFVRSLKRKTRQKLVRYPDLIEAETLNSVQTLSAFDQQFTAPVHGFPDAETYWRVSSSLHFLPQIRRPTLLINAVDDPFLPPTALPRAEVAENPWLTADFPESGGHGGFIEGGWLLQPVSWVPGRAIAFLQTQLQDQRVMSEVG